MSHKTGAVPNAVLVRIRTGRWWLFVPLAVLVCSWTVNCAFAAGEPEIPPPTAVLELSGTDWFICRDAEAGQRAQTAQVKTNETHWLPAKVPGNIQADLEAAHRLTPLWYGLGDERLYEVPTHDWWYRKDFAVPEAFEGKRLTLVFDGVDFECEVYLNGRQVGRHAGMFRRFWFDVTEQVRPGGINKLAVKVFRGPTNSVEWIRRTEEWGKPYFWEGIAATLRELKDLKTATNFGYDWGANIYTLGIWKDARLEATGPTRIEWVTACADVSEDLSEALVRVILETDSTGRFDGEVVCDASGSGRRFRARKRCSLQKGKNTVELSFSIDRPTLWWPNGQGDQPLYELSVRLAEGKSGAISDERETRFGVRRIEWHQVEGAPADFINPFQLVINGRPVRTIGSNIIPPDLLLGRIDEKLDMLIGHARRGGLNTLRIWGGGVVLPERFYRLADENGIMLSQEFPFANVVPPRAEDFLGNLETTVVNIIKQLRNHPSIIEWSGGNEMYWAQGDDHPALRLMRRLVRRRDSRIWRATCPIQGSVHGPWWYYHDSHYDYYNKRETMRHGEFGAQQPANLEVWHREIPPAAQWPITGYDNPYLIRKNVVKAIFEEHFWLAKQEVDRLFGPLENLEQLVRAGQLLGAEGIRYAADSHRQRGRRIGGFTTWDYNEPWPNGAGTYLIDHDGRPTMEYHFYKRAIAPVALSLKHDTVRYDPAGRINTELWLVNDSASAMDALQWEWAARDRAGRVFASNRGRSDAERLEPVKVDTLRLPVPEETCLGPIFLEVSLRDSGGRMIEERIQLFGADEVTGPWRGLLVNNGPDEGNDASTVASLSGSLPAAEPENLAYVGNGAQPARASSEDELAKHKAGGLNDGKYGNNHGWISGDHEKSPSFVIELAKTAEVGRFKLGGNRKGGLFADRTSKRWRMKRLRIETSTDGRAWRTVFERDGIRAMDGYDPVKTMTIDVEPVRAVFVKVTVQPNKACIDEFEVYAPRAGAVDDMPAVAFGDADGAPMIFRPVKRTSLKAVVTGTKPDGDEELLEVELSNPGRMTAIFCEMHPLIEYRTDLFIDNNYCFVPPGQSRVVTVRARRTPKGGLSLAQTGWRISCWNADDVVIAPSADVLFALGRRDRMCREYEGCQNPAAARTERPLLFGGQRPACKDLPYLLTEREGEVTFAFDVSGAHASKPARLRLHTSDRSADTPTAVVVEVNGRHMARTLEPGLGIQNCDPAHLAYEATARFDLPKRWLKAGRNKLTVQVAGKGWFTWDAMDLVSVAARGR